MLSLRLQAVFGALFAAIPGALVGSLVDGYHYGQGHLFAQAGALLCFVAAYGWLMKKWVSERAELLLEVTSRFRERLKRVERDEVWDETLPGPYSAEEKAIEIARLRDFIDKTEGFLRHMREW